MECTCSPQGCIVSPARLPTVPRDATLKDLEPTTRNKIPIVDKREGETSPTLEENWMNGGMKGSKPGSGKEGMEQLTLPGNVSMSPLLSKCQPPVINRPARKAVLCITLVLKPP